MSFHYKVENEEVAHGLNWLMSHGQRIKRYNVKDHWIPYSSDLEAAVSTETVPITQKRERTLWYNFALLYLKIERT